MSGLKNYWANRSFRIGALIVLIVCATTVLGPGVWKIPPTTQNLAAILQPPSAAHPLGTDFYGRDILSRIFYGGRNSLLVSFLATGLALVLGTGIGLLAGYCRGWLENLMMRLVDMVLGFPRLFIILLLVGVLPPSRLSTILILGGFSWMELARLVRVATKEILVTNYFRAGQALGLSHRRLITSYVLANLRPLILTSANLLFATMLTVESSLSFLGLGLTEPQASWGTLLNQGRLDPFGAWWVALSAGLAIIITVLGFNLLGDGMQQVQDESRR